MASTGTNSATQSVVFAERIDVTPFSWSIGSEPFRAEGSAFFPLSRAVYSAGWPECNGFIL
jgi:hypothetical protein